MIKSNNIRDLHYKNVRCTLNTLSALCRAMYGKRRKRNYEIANLHTQVELAYQTAFDLKLAISDSLLLETIEEVSQRLIDLQNNECDAGRHNKYFRIK